MFPKKIKILGEDWTIRLVDFDSDDYMDEETGGYCDVYQRMITIRDYRKEEMEGNRAVEVMKHICRHELTHAFFGESGLHSNTNSVDTWAVNEEMIDWLAKNIPKMAKVFERCGV